MFEIDFLGLILFAVVTSITPGPNNYFLFAHGKKFGLKGSIKLMTGIFLGFIVLLIVTGYGFSELIKTNPNIEMVLKVMSTVWLLYLAFKLSKLIIDSGTNTKQEIGFFQLFLMQFINPKAWIMAIGGVSAFMPRLENEHLRVFTFAFTFAIIGIPCMILWIIFGDYISKLIKTKSANKWLGITLFVLMVISTVTIWI